MNFRMCMALLCFGVCTVQAQGPPTRLSRVSLFGRDYVRLDQWAQSVNGRLQWTVPNRDVKVTWPGGSVQFTVDSRRCVLKGTDVWLSLPLAYKNGLAYLGAIDLPTALNPVLNPPRNNPGRRVK